MAGNTPYLEHLARLADLERTVADLEKENELLRTALGTPEVYAGVITEALEKDYAKITRALLDSLSEIKTLRKKLGTAYELLQRAPRW